MICEIYELYLYFVVDFLNDWWGCEGNGRGCEGTEEDATEQRRGPWYRLVFQPVAKEVLGTG